VTRVAVIGDVHGNLAALEAVLDDIGRQGVDAVLCTGDLVNYGPEPSAVIDRVLEVATVCVAGNHDLLLARWDGEPLATRRGRDMAVEEACVRWTSAHLRKPDRTRLAALPGDAVWRSLLVVHGSPRSADDYVFPDAGAARWAELAAATGARGCAALVMGHTHLPLQVVWEGIALFNAGSVGWPKDGDPRAAYGLVRLAPWSASVRRVAYDAHAVATAMRSAGLPEAVATAIAEGRPA
jgi:putative phosphoesterase